jgi:hypothetical protein
MTDEQRYLFDTLGYLHVPGVFGGAELAAAQEAAQRYIDAADDELPEGFSTDGRRHVHGFAFDKALERFALHPGIWPVVNELMDGRPRLVSGTMQIDTEPLGLHCARDDFHWSVPQYGVRDGRVFAEQIVVFPYFDDVLPGDGGLLVVPGSHKAAFDRPAGVFGATTFETAADLPAGIINVTPRAGDYAVISERLTHGTLRWQPTDRLRRVLVLRYQPQFNPGGGSLPEAIRERLDPETLELTERAGYRDIKKLVVARGGPPGAACCP